LSTNTTYWGLDLGGENIEGIILASPNNPQVLARMRVPTEQEKGYQHVLERLKLTYDIIRKQVGHTPLQIGVSVPGMVDLANKVHKNCSVTCLNNKNLKHDLQQLLNVEVLIENDGNCLVLAETKLGIVKEKAPDAVNVFGAIMSTGVGGGWMLHHKLFRGRHHLAGEWGHTVISHTGKKCYCGKYGCLETFIGAPALQELYFSITKQHASIKDIIQLSDALQTEARAEIVKHLLKYYALAISNIVHLIDPEVIVLGGELSHFPELFEEGKQQIGELIFDSKLQTTFLKARFRESSCVFGAALLAAGFE
jgi:predicted NBD/HSP70 family sugar kinase